MASHESHEHFHSECLRCQTEMEESYREHIGSWRVEKQRRESIAIARQDLDMADAPESEVMTGILLRLK